MILTPIQKTFVLHWGEMGTRWGINRTVAQIHALLFISPEPLDAEALAEQLVAARPNDPQARANLQLAQNDLDNTVIRAPIAGVAGNRAGQVGQYVKAGTQLLSLVPLSSVYVTANFKETQLTRMQPGQTAEVTVDAYPDVTLEGRIESFAPGSGAQFSLLPPDNATGNFTKIVQRVPVRIALPQDAPLAGLLRPGLSVTVTVDTREGVAGMVAAAHAQSAGASAHPDPQ